MTTHTNVIIFSSILFITFAITFFIKFQPTTTTTTIQSVSSSSSSTNQELSSLVTQTTTATITKALLAIQILIPNEDDYNSILSNKILRCTTRRVAAAESSNNLGEGHFLDFQSMNCSPIPNFYPKLKEFEVSKYELSCVDDISNNIWEKLSPKNRQWSFEDHHQHSTLSNNNSNNNKNNFFFHTSWLFRQWLKYDEQLEEEVDDDKNKDDFEYRAKHDEEKFYGMYRMENFCVHPYSGLHGYFPKNNNNERAGTRKESPSSKKYQGQEETRGVYHDEKKFAWFLDNPSSLKTPPKRFDQRPVIFIPISGRSRNNVAHTLQRTMSLIGMLMKKSVMKRNESIFHQSSSSSSSSSSPSFFDFENTDQENKNAIRPLLILVNHVVDGGYSHAPSLGLYYRLFPDFPWASITLSSGLFVEDYLKSMFQKVQNGFRNENLLIHSNKSNSNNNNYNYFMTKNSWNDHKEGTGMLCFKQGFAWQNCKRCKGDGLSENNDTRFPEPYSFGNHANGRTSERKAMVMMYREMILKKCLKLEAMNNKNTNTKDNDHSSARSSNYQPPRVFFDIRSKGRGILDLPLFMQLIENRTKYDSENNNNNNFISEILWREGMQGSRYEYIKDVYSSDILIGTHGAAFANLVLMKNPKTSVIVEFSTFYEFTKRRIRPWFRPFSAAVGIEDHWSVSVGRQQLPSRPGRFLKIAPSVIVAYLKEAVCRHRRRRENPNNNNDNKDKDTSIGPSSCSSSYFLIDGMKVPRPQFPPDNFPDVISTEEFSNDKEDFAYQVLPEHNALLVKDLTFVFSAGTILLSNEEAMAIEKKLRSLRTELTRKRMIRVSGATPKEFWKLFFEHWTEAHVQFVPKNADGDNEQQICLNSSDESSQKLMKFCVERIKVLEV